MNRIRKGDQVIVIAGKDKGKKGDVVRVVGDRSSFPTSTSSSATPSRTRRPASRAA
jgi:transcription elongation factor